MLNSLAVVVQKSDPEDDRDDDAGDRGFLLSVDLGGTDLLELLHGVGLGSGVWGAVARTCTLPLDEVRFVTKQHVPLGDGVLEGFIECRDGQ